MMCYDVQLRSETMPRQRAKHVRETIRRDGYVLLAVLIVLVVLSLAAYRYSDMTMAEYRATNRILNSSQAKALADSGIHYTAAMLADPAALANTLGGNPFNNPSAFGGNGNPRGIPVDLGGGRTGYFSVMCLDYTQDPGQGSLPPIYGVVDEASKINLNALMLIDPSGTVAYNSLMKLPNMSDSVANSIIDWIDSDDNERSGGAESSYYEALQPKPYRCKNAPLDSVEELLLVQGVTPALLYGSDTNRNGQLEPDEAANYENTYSPGWAPYLTVYSREPNLDSTGAPRVNINGKSLQTVYTQLQAAVGDPMAAYIVAYRYLSPPAANAKSTAGTSDQLVAVVQKALAGNQPPKSARNIASIYQLIGTSVSVPGQGNQPATVYSFSITGPTTAGTDLSMLLDKTSTVASPELPARINVNTASPTVLAALPGLTPTDVTAILAARPAIGSADATDPIYLTPAWLYTNANLDKGKLQALDRYVTARTQVYRIQSIGYFEKGGPVIRIEAVVDTNGGMPRFLYYRDLTDLGRAIDPRNN